MWLEDNKTKTKKRASHSCDVLELIPSKRSSSVSGCESRAKEKYINIDISLNTILVNYKFVVKQDGKVVTLDSIQFSTKNHLDSIVLPLFTAMLSKITLSQRNSTVCKYLCNGIIQKSPSHFSSAHIIDGYHRVGQGAWVPKTWTRFIEQRSQQAIIGLLTSSQTSCVFFLRNLQMVCRCVL